METLGFPKRGFTAIRDSTFSLRIARVFAPVCVRFLNNKQRCNNNFYVNVCVELLLRDEEIISQVFFLFVLFLS